MVAEREAKEMEMAGSGMEEDASYNSADVQDLPKPPYHFKVSFIWTILGYNLTSLLQG